MDKKFLKKLKSLKQESSINPDNFWVDKTRKNILNQISETEDNRVLFAEQFVYFFNIFAPQKMSLVTRPLMVFFLSIAIIMGSWGVGAASAYSIPGDLFYKIKRASEGIEVVIASMKPENKTVKQEKNLELQLKFATRRADEVKQVLSTKEPKALKHVPKTIDSLHKNIESAKESVKELKDIALEDGGSAIEGVLVAATSFNKATKEIGEIIEKGLDEIDEEETEEDEDSEDLDEEIDMQEIDKKVSETGGVLNEADIQVIEQAVEIATKTSELDIDDSEKIKVNGEVEELLTNKAEKLAERALADSAEIKDIEKESISLSELEIVEMNENHDGELMSSSSKKISTETIQEASTKADKVSDGAQEILVEVKDIAEGNLLDALQKVRQLSENVVETGEIVESVKQELQKTRELEGNLEELEENEVDEDLIDTESLEEKNDEQEEAVEEVAAPEDLESEITRINN